MKTKLIFCAVVFLGFFGQTRAQIDEDQLGGWYMYFFDASVGEKGWGFQGDIQFRNWNVMGDLEQLLLRGGVTYAPKGWAGKFTLGYGNITTGTFGVLDDTTNESRVYQELLMPQKLGWRIFLKHRFRYEQRWVQNQDFRTRYRYNLFLTVPINDTTVHKNVWYISLYNELFINGEREIGDGRTVELFDRNRAYGAIGYAIQDNLKVQFGYMNQTTNSWSKNQLQFSLHHSF